MPSTPTRRAQRSVHREQLQRFGDELEFLHDSSTVQADALGQDAASTEAHLRCHGLSSWMINQFATWADANSQRLNWDELFDKQDLGELGRIAVRSTIQDYPGNAYAPGITAMAEIHAAIPALARRENLPDSAWPMIAREAYGFGASISRNNTDVQNLIRSYLYGQSWDVFSSDVPKFDTTKLKLDQELGITTVVPLQELIEIAKDASSSDTRVCVALQVGSTQPDACNMFQACWNTFSDLSERLVYPGVVTDQNPLPIVGLPKDDPEETIRWYSEIYNYSRTTE